MSTCNKCDAEIIWARTPRGKMIPLDPEEDIFGTVAVNNFESEPIARFLRPGQEPAGHEALHVKHFDTCDPDHKRPKPVRVPTPPIVWGAAYTEDKVEADKVAWLNGLSDDEFLAAFIAYSPTPSRYLTARNLRLIELMRKLAPHLKAVPDGETDRAGTIGEHDPVDEGADGDEGPGDDS